MLVIDVFVNNVDFISIIVVLLLVELLNVFDAFS